jgi:hypothetical protein
MCYRRYWVERRVNERAGGGSMRAKEGELEISRSITPPLLDLLSRLYVRLRDFCWAHCPGAAEVALMVLESEC